MQGSPVMVRLQVGRWRCGNGRCARKIFTERVPELALPWARRTERLRDVVRLIGHGMGGRPGEKLLSRLGMAVSDDTILRTVKRVDVDPAAVPLRVVGVDDWAWKKGQTYGTILVDLERNGVVDLLPERSAESLAAWLAHLLTYLCSKGTVGTATKPFSNGVGAAVLGALVRIAGRPPFGTTGGNFRVARQPPRTTNHIDDGLDKRLGDLD
jgi:hypothetical protein